MSSSLSDLAVNAPSSIEHMNDGLSVAFALFGLFITCTALTAGVWSDMLHIPAPLLSTAFGVICGPKVLNILSFGTGWTSGKESDIDREILLWLCRIVVGIQVLSGGVSLPSKLLVDRSFARSMLTLLLPQMTVAWLVTALLVWLILPGVGWPDALVVGACVAPTDPVVAAAAIQQKFAFEHVPERVRHVILCESCFNDGTGTPFVFASLMILLRSASVVHQPPWSKSKQEAAVVEALASHHDPTWKLISKLITNVLLWNVLVGALLGIVLGIVAMRLLKHAREREWLKEESTNIFTIVFAIGVIGLSEMLDVNEMLACFMAGNALNWDNYFHERELNTHFTEGLDSLLDVIVFTFIGTILPSDVWFHSQTWSVGQLFLLSATVILFRRLPAVLAFSFGIPSLHTWRERFFTGWFGPMGVAAIYYAVTCMKEVDEESYLDVNLFPIISWLVTTSVVIHGITVPVLMLVILPSAGSYGPLFLPNAGDQERQHADAESEGEEEHT